MIHYPQSEGAPPLRLALLYTTFPKGSEVFLQREVEAYRALGISLQVYSLFGGGGDFKGLKIHRFSLWQLLKLPWIIPRAYLRHPNTLWTLTKGLFGRRPPSWLNFWENMLGAGFAGILEDHFARLRPDWIHAAWAGAPATAAWLLRQFLGLPYSTGAHAYDVYEHGGDWWLLEKLSDADFVHCSTIMAADTLASRGVPKLKIHTLRRGLSNPPAKAAAAAWTEPLHLLCIARLVPKKGLRQQMHIHRALLDAGIPITVRIVGEGPLRAELQALIQRLRLGDSVRLLGHLPPERVQEELARAHILLHTGVIAASGDRDGLPNVIPEAMAAGVLVISSPEAATREAVSDGQTGLLADPNKPGEWIDALTRLRQDPALRAHLREGALQWIRENYLAEKSARAMIQLITSHLAAGKPPSP